MEMDEANNTVTNSPPFKKPYNSPLCPCRAVQPAYFNLDRRWARIFTLYGGQKKPIRKKLFLSFD